MGDGHQVGVVGGQVGQAGGGRGVAFVGNVVGRAGEAIDGRDGLAQVRRAQHGRDREILVMGYRRGPRGNVRLRGLLKWLWRGSCSGWGCGRYFGRGGAGSIVHPRIVA